MASYQYIFTMQKLRKVFGSGKEVLKGIHLQFFPGAKIGILGHNGAGKSTLLKIMAGVDKEFLGEAWPAEGVRIGYLPQEPELDPDKDVKGNIEEAVSEMKGILDRFNEVSMKLGEVSSDEEMNQLLEEQGNLQDKIEAGNGWDLDHTLEVAMDALRTPPGDSEVTHLSGGERRRVALTRLLLEKPDLLLLDEPTNHLDAESVAWLEKHLHDYPGTVVAITHDRYFLDNVAGWILELDRGHGIPWEGNYSSWLDQKSKRLAKEEKENTKREQTLARELEWINMTPRARQAKSKARINAYNELLEQSKEQRKDVTNIRIPFTKRLGSKVVEFKNVKKAFGEKLLFDDLNFTLPPGGIVGIIGPNGAGKTTMFKLLVGAEEPDAGTITIGDTVDVAYVDQSRDAPRPRQDGVGGDQRRAPRPDRHGRQARDSTPAPTWASVQLHRCPDQQKLVGSTCPAESATAFSSPRCCKHRRQRAAPRRAHQRPRRRYPAPPRARLARLPGLCGHHLPRPLVLGPRGHPHPGLRGRQQSDLVRGELRRLRSRPEETTWG